MHTLGMIGGTSWHSTIIYYREINEKVGEAIGRQSNPTLILYSINVELMRSGDTDRIKRSYLDIALKLQQAGAEAIIICANTPHLVYAHVAPKLDIPILHIADATGQAAQEQGLQQLGLLGTRPAMTIGFIQDHLKQKYDIDCLIPEEQFIDETHDFIADELTQGQFTDAAKAFFLEQMRLLRDRGADGIILGCTELPMLLDQDDFELPMLPTTQLHIQMAVDFILDGKQ